MVSLYISTDSMNHLLQLPTKSPLLISWQAEVQRVINCCLGFLCWIWIDCRLKNPWWQGYKIIEWERWWKGDMWGGKGCRKGWFLHPQVGNHSSFGDCRNLNGAISNIGHFLFPPFPLKALKEEKGGLQVDDFPKVHIKKSISQVLLTFCNPCWNVAGDTRPQFVSCISL